MEMIYYTIAALLLYGISDYILNAIEIKLEKRLPNRSLVFFSIITILAISLFSVIRVTYKGPDPVQTSNKAPSAQAPATINPPQSAPAANSQPPTQLKTDPLQPHEVTSPSIQNAEPDIPQ